MPVRYIPLPESRAQGREQGGLGACMCGKAGLAWDGFNPPAGLSRLKGCSSILPSKDKEQMPKLGSACWGGTSAALIIGT